QQSTTRQDPVLDEAAIENPAVLEEDGGTSNRQVERGARRVKLSGRPIAARPYSVGRAVISRGHLFATLPLATAFRRAVDLSESGVAVKMPSQTGHVWAARPTEARR
ncbi:hypothetical protein ACFWWB_39270, partial [Streptomyces sp. NPDC058690]|uniref:hypothetical protein n=1 Tax=Streptomyces sp. NPDC058690 TaxID=3346600 RepID=UPI00365A3FBF